MPAFRKKLNPSSTWLLDIDWAEKALFQVQQNVKNVIVPDNLEQIRKSTSISDMFYDQPRFRFSRTAWRAWKRDPSQAQVYLLQKVSPTSLSLVNAYKNLPQGQEKQVQFLRNMYLRALCLLEQPDFVAKVGRSQIRNCLTILERHPVSDWKLECLAHADFHPGNILLGICHKKYRIIDWENLTLGSAFFDLLFCASNFSLFPDLYKSIMITHEEALGRKLQLHDFAQPLCFFLIRMEAQISHQGLTKSNLAGLSFLTDQYELIHIS